MSGGEKKPQIDFENGVFCIKGRSVALSLSEVYKPFLQKFTSYSTTPSALTLFDIELEYINSESTRALLSIFVIAEKIQRRGHKVKVNWHYAPQDIDMLQQGKELESVLDIPFEFISIS